MSQPADKELYDQVKKEVYRAIPEHSAYRSGILVKTYKASFKRKHGDKKPYTGAKKKEGLTRWFAEEWKNQRGEEGYQKKGDVYRPTKRVNKKTPVTFKELTQQQISEAQKEKAKTGRVKRFKEKKPPAGAIKRDGYFFVKSSNRGKKYDVYNSDGKKLASFGGVHKNGKPYEQFKDRIGLFSAYDHGDADRKKRYYQRHGVSAKKESPKWFSHKFLW